MLLVLLLLVIIGLVLWIVKGDVLKVKVLVIKDKVLDLLGKVKGIFVK